MQFLLYILDIYVFIVYLFISGIDGQGDMKHIYGTIVAKKKAKQGREDKVIQVLTFDILFIFDYILSFYFLTNFHVFYFMDYIIFASVYLGKLLFLV